jgi:hypothetical protein
VRWVKAWLATRRAQGARRPARATRLVRSAIPAIGVGEQSVVDALSQGALAIDGSQSALEHALAIFGSAWGAEHA